MISFLNSTILPLLAAVLIPLFIYLFRRQKARNIPFSSLRFLKMLENQRIRNLKIYQILLLLVRMAFLLFLVLAFARPALQTLNLTGESTGAVSAVIIMDDSYSMQAYDGVKTRYEQGLEALRTIGESFKEQDKVLILSGRGSDANQIRPEKGTGNMILPLHNLLQKATVFFTKHPNLNKELYLVSDGLINHQMLPDSLPPSFYQNQIRAYLIRCGDDDSFLDAGIDSVELATRILGVNHPVRFNVRLSNHSLQEKMTVHLNLFNWNKRIAMRQKELEPGETGRLEINYVPEKTGLQKLHFELDDDILPINNYYYASISIPDQVRVLFVSPLSRSPLQTAVSTIAEQSGLRIDPADYSAWQGRQFNQYDLIVLNDPAGFSSSLISRLKGYMESGRRLMVIPGESMTPAQFNIFTRALLNKDVLGEWVRANEENQFFQFSKDFARQEVFTDIFLDANKELAPPRIFQYFKLIHPPEKIIELDNREVFLAYYPVNESAGGVYLFASSLDIAWTDLPLQGFFIPMLHRLFFAAGSNAEQTRGYLVGQQARIELNMEDNLSEMLLHPPHGEPYPLTNVSAGSGRQVYSGTLTEPGHYILKEQGMVRDIIPVNLSSNELQPPFIPKVKVLPDIEEIAATDIDISQLKKNRTGQELWLLFIVLAILMLLLELWLIKLIEKSGWQKAPVANH